MELVINNIGWFLELLMIEICIHIVWDRKFQFNFFTVVVFFCNEAVFTLYFSGIAPYNFKYITFVLVWIQCYYEFRGSIIETVVKFLISITFAGITEILSAIISVPFRQIIDAPFWMFIIENIIALVIVSVFWCLLYRRKHSISLKRKDKKYFSVVIICAVPLLIMLLDYWTNRTMNAIYDLVISVLIVLIYRYLNKVQTAENELAKKNLELEMQRVYSSTYQELLAEVRRRQHDFKNQLTAIYSTHMVAESFEDLVQMQQEYCEKLEENSRYDQILTKCNEPILAGFLYYKCIACEKENVRVEYQVTIDQIKCQMALHELIEVLGIFMDNACEHVMENPDGDRKIQLNLQEDENAVTIEIENPSRYLKSQEIEEMFVTGYSTKGENRGLGLSRVKQLVEKYKLELVVSNEMREEHNWLLFRLVI